MQFKVLIVLAVIGCVTCQRGHYAGASRPILGQRYQNMNLASNPQPQSNSIQQQASPAQASPAQAPPVQSNFVAPPAQSNFVASVPQPIGNRFEGPSNNYYNQPPPQQLGPFGFGSYPFIGPHNHHNHGNFNNGGYNGFYGRR